MFLLLAASLLVLYPIVRRGRRGGARRYEQLSIAAVRSDRSEQEVTKPTDLPDEIDFFIITYRVGDAVYKICRNSVTVPQFVKRYNKLQCTQAVAIDELGSTRDVTATLQPYSGPVANFLGNEVSLVDILKHHGVQDVQSVLTVVRDVSWRGVLRDPTIQLHTGITVTNVIH